jgi:hypothetical protein
MTFRHIRSSGNVLKVGSDRISTAADLKAFQNELRNRGTGELVRFDADAARRLGAEFLEHSDVMRHLDKIGDQLTRQLREARAAGRGKNYTVRPRAAARLPRAGPRDGEDVRRGRASWHRDGRPLAVRRLLTDRGGPPGLRQRCDFAALPRRNPGKPPLHPNPVRLALGQLRVGNC